MNTAKKMVIVICSIILMGFTLTDLGNVTGALPVCFEESGHKEPTISGHGDKSVLILDVKSEESGTGMRRNMRMEIRRMDRSTTLFLVCFFVFWAFVFSNTQVWNCLRVYRYRVFYLERFLYELITQKEKDGKKRGAAIGEFL